MSSNNFLSKSLEECDFQLRAVLTGYPATHLDTKVAPTAMSVRESVEHLAMVYHATNLIAHGETFDWGSGWSTGITDFNQLMEKMFDLRLVAIMACMRTPDQHEIAMDYIAMHDSYHIGQLCLMRMSVDSAWDPYSLYQH